MRNVAGLSTSEAQKSSDLFMKCRYLDELTGNKGVIFATGTPISNSMTEMFTMQRYLQHDRLSALSLLHFDSWASIFGETQTSIELAPEGTGYRARMRFAKFHNLAEGICCKGSLKKLYYYSMAANPSAAIGKVAVAA
jgi:N12 class adenine-specific DNA methylase